MPYDQVEYGTCVDLGSWGAVVAQGWNRVVQLTGAEAKAMKQQINTMWIYLPKADRAEAFAAAEPGKFAVV